MPRCIKCKDSFEKKYPNQIGKFRYCLNKDECIKEFWQKVRDKRISQDTKERKEKLETVQDLMKKAQRVFNTWIRKRDKNKPCISCGKPDTGKRDASHYYSSGNHKAVTFNEDNVHASCVYCNQYLAGNLLNYQIGLTERIGADRVFKLNEQAHKTAKYSREELKDIIRKYK